MVKVWEEENDGFFFVNGQKYLELIKTQQNDRKTKKDLLKLGKVLRLAQSICITFFTERERDRGGDWKKQTTNFKMDMNNI